MSPTASAKPGGVEALHEEAPRNDLEHAIVPTICSVQVAEWRLPDGVIAQCNSAALQPLTTRDRGA